MKFKNTYIIALIFLVLGAYVYFYVILGEADRRRAEEERNRIYLFERNDVVKLQITRADTTIEFVKQDDGWMLRSPVIYKGDSLYIEALIEIFRRSKNVLTVAENTENLEIFGLGSDEIKLTVTVAGGDEYSVLIGDMNPAGGYAYARLPEQSGVFLTALVLRDMVVEPVLYYRDKTILDFEKDNINKIVFHKKDKEIIVERRDEEWRVTKPVDYPGDKKTIELKLKVVSTAKIANFVDENPTNLEKYGLQSPENWMEIFDGITHTKKTLFFGNFTAGNFFARDDDKNPIFELDSNTVMQLTPGLGYLRDKIVVDYDRDIIDVLKITYLDSQPLAEYVFHKEDSTGLWYMITPPPEADQPLAEERQKAQSQKINGIIKDIFWTRAEDFIDNVKNFKQYGLDPPVADFLMLSNGEEMAHVQMGKEVGKHRYFYSITKNQLFKVRSGLYPMIVVPINELLEK